MTIAAKHCLLCVGHHINVSQAFVNSAIHVAKERTLMTL